MNQKLLITPPITPGGIPEEEDLMNYGMDGEMIVAGGEQSTKKVQLIHGAPEHFHSACRKLLASLSGKANALLVGGTTGEAIGFGLKQWQVLMTAMKNACPPDIRIMAGLLGRDDMIREQIRIAHELGIQRFVLGLNHTGDNQRRFENAKGTFGSNDELWLYNLPMFDPASLEFIKQCAQDERVKGIKDSSKGTDAQRIRSLLEIKRQRPDFQVLIGSEAVYGTFLPADFEKIDGLVSGNSNADPDLLRRFTDNPSAFKEERDNLHTALMNKPPIRYQNDIAKIQQHIHGMKLDRREAGILAPANVMLYQKLGSLFIPHSTQ